ncbi:unnamed protein product, partial [Rotaria magnacalcarata]
MTDPKQLNREHQSQKRTIEYLPRSLKQNWKTGIIRDEIAILQSL